MPCFSGHRLLDLKPYEDWLAEMLQDYEPEQAVIGSALESVPIVG